jgi:hypothetical protein
MNWKDLEKMTVVKIREEALKHKEIQGVRGKSKAQIMDELAALLNIEKPHVQFTEKVFHTKEDMKLKIRQLKKERDTALGAHDHGKLHELRREMHRLKHQIRKVEAADRE